MGVARARGASACKGGSCRRDGSRAFPLYSPEEHDEERCLSALLPRFRDRGRKIFLKMSADAATTWLFIAMQVAGNLAGFVGVLAYTGLLRTLPLQIAFPLSRGMAVLGVQVIAAVSLCSTKSSVSPRRSASCGSWPSGSSSAASGKAEGGCRVRTILLLLADMTANTVRHRL